ncbi:MAG: family 10 glycosylhydrolase [Chitinophagaceae bacterium]|nr:family 10 glycosylhydrolase [Chitinophagaceae bacterium]
MFVRLLPFLTALYLILLHSSAKAGFLLAEDSMIAPPKVPAEFRGAWIATVANINWPSAPGLSTEVQQQEAIRLLDFLKEHHFNAVIFQVRPQADALYESKLEPWSYFLTGKQGRAPKPYYDPLTFWIEAAHARGLELHVWLNPYRAHHTSGGKVTETSVVKQLPWLVKRLREGFWWFDPSKKGTQDHAAAVVMDIVNRYDIDGVHFDDYFYPYPAYNRNEDFPDGDSWAAYVNGGGTLTRNDWRRDGVNKFIERIYKDIKSIKPYVKFGVSPFGIWRPGYPSSVQGFDQYEKLYADARLWLNKGWLDYMAPQLYWPINKIGQSFPVLLGWWAEENSMRRHLWPGINVGMDSSAKNVNEIMAQIMIARGMLPESKGVLHWSISSVTRNPNMAKALIDGPYKAQALVPATRWLDSIPPAEPLVLTAPEESLMQVSWSHPNEKDVAHWVLYYQHGQNWQYKILGSSEHSYTLNTLEGDSKLINIAVTAVDRCGNESEMQTRQATARSSVD